MSHHYDLCDTCCKHFCICKSPAMEQHIDTKIDVMENRQAKREAQAKELVESYYAEDNPDVPTSQAVKAAWLTTRILALLAATERAVLEEAATMLDAEAETILKEWDDDASVPRQTHESADCKDRCDGYALCQMTFNLMAHKLRQRAQEVGP